MTIFQNFKNLTAFSFEVSKISISKFSKLSKIEWEFHGGKNLGSRFSDPFLISLFSLTSQTTPPMLLLSFLKNFRKNSKKLFLKSDNSKVKSVEIEMKCSQIFWGYIYGARKLFKNIETFFNSHTLT